LAVQDAAIPGRVTHWLDSVTVWGAGVGLALLLGLLAGRSWAAPVAAAAVVAVGAYYARVFGLQVGLVVLLIAASVADHFTFPIGPVAVRAEQIAVVAALIALVVTNVRGGGASWLKPSLAEGMLLAWFACSAVSSLLASPDRRLSLKILVLVGVCSLALFLPRRLLAGPQAGEKLETVIRWLLIAFATEAAYGALMYTLHVFGLNISLSRNPASGHVGAYGTLWEPNVFGAFAAAGAVAWVYVGPGRFRRPWLGLVACVAGLFDSVTRAAWLVAALAGALGLALPGLRRRFDARTLGLGALGSVAVVGGTVAVEQFGMYTINPPVTTGGRGLLAAILNLVDVVGRINQLSPILGDIRGHILLGRGTASFEALHVASGIPEHVASLPLLVLNDTGLIGLALFGGFVAAVFARAWSRRGVAIVAALGQVAVVIGLTNLATETMELMIGWLLVGLLMAAADHAGVDTPAPE
jgi:hypothetical protein